MKRIVVTCAFALSALAVFAQAPAINPSQTGLVGLWEFENAGNLLEATVGSDLTEGGTTGTWSQVSGPTGADHAVAKSVGSHFVCDHGIAANGGGSNVNKWSMVVDFKVPNISSWKCFLQTNTANSNDGDLFVNTSGNVGVAALTYSSTALIANEWYRLAFTVDAGNDIKIYLDGELWNAGDPSTLDGRFALDLANLLLFADDNAEDNPMDISVVALYDRTLSDNEVFILGGYGHMPDVAVIPSDAISPYLQSPTPTSMYVSWHCTEQSSTKVKYGTSSSNLDQTVIGTNEVVDGGNTSYVWHTVELTGLTPNTEYFYRCYSGSGADSTTMTYAFRTPATPTAPGQHIRVVVIGDSRTDVTKTTQHISSIKNKLTQLYGADLHNHIDLIANVGDIVTNGSSISQYKTEYFTPYAPLTHAIPNNISIGNHEGNSAKFYDYMKYENFTTDYDAPHPYNEKFYQFQLGSAQFIFLNANTNYRISDQIAWLDDRLRESEADPTYDFIFSFTHQPGHSEVWPDGNEAYVYNDILGLLNKFYKCAIHFSGHSHNYERGTVEMENSDLNLQHDMRELLSGGAGSALDRWGMYGNQVNYPEVNKSRDVYSWTLIDIDVDDRSYTATAYSWGNNDIPADNEVIDEFYRKITQPRPEVPSPAGVVNGETLVATPMVGVDSAYTCHFQITSFPGIYITPDLEIKQDIEDWYWDSGAPNYIPIDQNVGLDISRYTIQPGDGLIPGNTYGYRVRYRDYNLEWSMWSDEMTFVYQPVAASNTADFAANTTVATTADQIGFADLSSLNGVSWEWDFDNNGTVDSYDQDPVFQYPAIGLYTVKMTVNDGSLDHDVTKTDYILITDNANLIEMEASTDVSVYPNPFKGETTISFDLLNSDDLMVDVLDINGKVVASVFEGNLAVGKQEIKWNSNLKKGTYFVRITGTSNYGIEKIVIID